MERIATLLDKIREISTKPDAGIIDIDLMMDYTRVMYADLLEWRNKVAFTQAVTLGNMVPNPAESPEEPAGPPEVAGPAVELDATSLNYESADDTLVPETPFPLQSQYSGADIRQSIGINDKYQYISELFGNNKDAYEEVVSEINTFDTEDEALGWVRQHVAL